MVFVALDRLYVMDLPNSTPKRLVPSENVGEFMRAWSPDGLDRVRDVERC